MKVEFTSQSGRDGLNPAAQTGRLLNCFREPLVPGGKGQFQLRSVLGMAGFAAVDRVLMRDLHVFDGNLTLLCGGTLSSVTPAGVVTDIATLGDSPDSNISENTGYLTIAANGDYHVWDGEDLTSPATGAITAISSVSYLGGYTILTERDGRRMQWSALADPTTFNGLDFASAETTEEPLVRGMVWRDVFVAFKARHIEQWARTGRAGPDAFARVQGGDMELGLAGYELITAFPDGLCFVGSDGRVHVWAGQAQPISTPPVEVALQYYRPQRMHYHEFLGHGFICLTFRDAPAWCYDIATGEWHERAENDGPWTAAASVLWRGAWYVGTQSGGVARLSERREDFGRPLIRRAVSLPVSQRQPFRVSRVELFPVVGIHKQTSDTFELEDAVNVPLDNGFPLGDSGADRGDARISLRTSRNGIEFGPEKIRTLAPRGDYGRKIKWENLGQFRGVACFEVVLSSVNDIPLMSAAEVDLA